MATQNRINIVDGPSKFDLMMSCFGGKEVVFTITLPSNRNKSMQIKTRWITVGAEDGGGENWIVEFHKWESSPTRIFTGYYNSQRRTGWLDEK